MAQTGRNRADERVSYLSRTSTPDEYDGRETTFAHSECISCATVKGEATERKADVLFSVRSCVAQW